MKIKLFAFTVLSIGIVSCSPISIGRKTVEEPAKKIASVEQEITRFTFDNPLLKAFWIDSTSIFVEENITVEKPTFFKSGKYEKKRSIVDIISGEFTEVNASVLNADSLLYTYIDQTPNIKDNTVVGSVLSAIIQMREQTHASVGYIQNNISGERIKFSTAMTLLKQRGQYGDYWSPSDHRVKFSLINEKMNWDYDFTMLYPDYDKITYTRSIYDYPTLKKVIISPDGRYAYDGNFLFDLMGKKILQVDADLKNSMVISPDWTKVLTTKKHIIQEVKFFGMPPEIAEYHVSIRKLNID